MTTCLPGQSNADSTTAKLATHIPTTKVINAPLCQNQNNLMLDYFDGFLFLLPGRIEKLSLRGLRLERIDRRGRMGGRGGIVIFCTNYRVGNIYRLADRLNSQIGCRMEFHRNV